jgi:hypothetical protein
MNITSKLPTWAQAPAQQFIKREEIAGTETASMDQDSFQAMAEIAAGVISLTGNDEVPGVDESLGQPGVVSTQGVTVHFEGDPSNAEGTVEAVVVGKEGSTEVAMYVSSSPSGFSALQMAHADGQTEVQGGAVEQSFLGLSGFVIAGQV